MQSDGRPRLTDVHHRILGRAAALPLSVPLLLVSDWSPGAVSQVLDLLDVFIRLLQDLGQQPEV